jgi:GTP cyclohydrolase II
VAVRVHDSCCGSDVFGTDICTCRPYLVFAINACIECAQRGGVGLIVYFQKEGRGLGEVTKYRVYNARKNQAGGDSSESYFYQTESIAGIQDARFQEMMPDVLLWLGVSRIDWYTQTRIHLCIHTLTHTHTHTHTQAAQHVQ